MEDFEFQTTLQKIEHQLSRFNFEIKHIQYNHESFGNYYIDVTNGSISYRIIKDRSQYFLEGKTVDSDNWNEINPFVEAKFEGSILAFDMKLHKVGKGHVPFNI